MQLFNNNVLIKLEAEKTQLGNGLQVKETRGKRDIVMGTVVSLPTNIDSLTPGDAVHFPLYAANCITVNGEDYVVVNFNDIILKE